MEEAELIHAPAREEELDESRQLQEDEEEGSGTIIDTLHEPCFELLCTGTGAGATMAYEGEASSGFLIRYKNQLLLQCDLGLGTIQAVRSHARSAVPSNLYISHNHSDHSGELPICLAVESKSGRDMTVYAHPEVMDRLLSHRLHELLSTGKPLTAFGSFCPTPDGTATPLQDTTLTITPIRARHSEVAFGLIIHDHDEPLVGWTADSAYDEDLYAALVRSGAGTLVVDARFEDTAEHAGFERLREWVRHELPRVHYDQFKTTKHLPHVYVTGYGSQGEILPDEMLTPIRVLRPGTVIRLNE